MSLIVRATASDGAVARTRSVGIWMRLGASWESACADLRLGGRLSSARAGPRGVAGNALGVTWRVTARTGCWRYRERALSVWAV
jgi:hypothetical protein